mmetsp:Transcript_8406/g.26751  ORF Transcript_8406/g.26751 Transcript_8406/m.26751 type:complete len:422 (+) Transcript_8406:129-1394(+)
MLVTQCSKGSNDPRRSTTTVDSAGHETLLGRTSHHDAKAACRGSADHASRISLHGHCPQGVPAWADGLAALPITSHLEGLGETCADSKASGLLSNAVNLYGRNGMLLMLFSLCPRLHQAVLALVHALAGRMCQHMLVGGFGGHGLVLVAGAIRRLEEPHGLLIRLFTPNLRLSSAFHVLARALTGKMCQHILVGGVDGRGLVLVAHVLLPLTLNVLSAVRLQHVGLYDDGDGRQGLGHGRPGRPSRRGRRPHRNLSVLLLVGLPIGQEEGLRLEVVDAGVRGQDGQHVQAEGPHRGRELVAKVHVEEVVLVPVVVALQGGVHIRDREAAGRPAGRPARPAAARPLAARLVSGAGLHSRRAAAVLLTASTEVQLPVHIPVVVQQGLEAHHEPAQLRTGAVLHEHKLHLPRDDDLLALAAAHG